MQYVIHIRDAETAEFIGEHFNEGVVPIVESPPTFYLINDDAPNEIIDASAYLKRIAGTDDPTGIIIERL